MVTISELSRHWNFSHQYVSRCVKAGCPLDDFESADLWRQANAKRPGRKKPKVDNIPDEDSPEARSGRKKYWEDKPEGWNPKTETLEEALDNSARSCQEAWRYLYEALIEGKPSQISVWMNLHNKAVEGRVKTEAMIRAELERQKVLVPLSEAKTLIRRVVEIVVSRLSAMPQNIAPRCNPGSPEHAMDILQDECTSIIADAQKAVMS